MSYDKYEFTVNCKYTREIHSLLYKITLNMARSITWIVISTDFINDFEIINLTSIYMYVTSSHNYIIQICT